jgi:hypothetical protein
MYHLNCRSSTNKAQFSLADPQAGMGRLGLLTLVGTWLSIFSHPMRHMWQPTTFIQWTACMWKGQEEQVGTPGCRNFYFLLPLLLFVKMYWIIITLLYYSYKLLLFSRCSLGSFPQLSWCHWTLQKYLDDTSHSVSIWSCMRDINGSGGTSYSNNSKGDYWQSVEGEPDFMELFRTLADCEWLSLSPVPDHLVKLALLCPQSNYNTGGVFDAVSSCCTASPT